MNKMKKSSVTRTEIKMRTQVAVYRSHRLRRAVLNIDWILT
jgi:hypothetical protein